MSQHKITTTQNGISVEVLVGWDRPLNRFFLVVEPTESITLDIESSNDEDYSDDENDGYIYSNLSDKALLDEPIHYQDLGYFKRILEGLNISIPDETWEAVKEDKKLNR